MKIAFEKCNGLVPAIIQDESSGEVLMLGFMNEEALAETQRTRQSGVLQPFAEQIVAQRGVQRTCAARAGNSRGLRLGHVAGAGARRWPRSLPRGLSQLFYTKLENDGSGEQ